MYNSEVFIRIHYKYISLAYKKLDWSVRINVAVVYIVEVGDEPP